MGQLPQTIPIHLDDTFNHHDTAYIGTNVNATFCADAALGEVPPFQLPLPPLGLRIVLRNPRPGSCWQTLGNDYRYRTPNGIGQAIDLRPLVGNGQVDTFRLYTQEGGILSWGDVSTAYLGNVRLTDGFVNGLLDIDMKQTNMLDMALYSGYYVYIIAEQMSPGPGVPNLTEFGEMAIAFTVIMTGAWLIRRRLYNQF